MGKNKKAGKNLPQTAKLHGRQQNGKETYKADIVKDAIEKFPKAKTNAIARLVVKEYPEDFNFESARTMVRVYRDGLFGAKPELRTVDERKEAMSNFKIPQTDYKEIDPFIVPAEHNKLLILSDVHVPYHDVEAIELALDYGEKHGMNAIYLNGDFMDCYGISRFTPDRRLRDMKGEIEDVREFLGYLKERYNLPIYYKIGNHEDRWEAFLKNKAPELLGVDDFELSKILRFEDFGVTLVKSKQIAKVGKLNLMHGHEFVQSVISPVNVARGLYLRAKVSAMVGHHHQTSEHTEKSMNDEIVTCWSVGALCGMKPDYMPYNKWNLGFAMIEFNPENGHFFVDNKRIINGEVR